MHKTTLVFLLSTILLAGCSSTHKSAPPEPALQGSIDQITDGFTTTKPHMQRNWRSKEVAFNAQISRFYNDLRNNMIHLSLIEPNSKYRCIALVTFTTPDAKKALMDNFYETDLVSVTGKVSDYSTFDPKTNCAMRILNPKMVKLNDVR